MTILYCVICRRDTVLAKYAARVGNFSEISDLVIARIPAEDGKMTYRWAAYVVVLRIRPPFWTAPGLPILEAAALAAATNKLKISNICHEFNNLLITLRFLVTGKYKYYNF